MPFPQLEQSRRYDAQRRAEQEAAARAAQEAARQTMWEEGQPKSPSSEEFPRASRQGPAPTYVPVGSEEEYFTRDSPEAVPAWQPRLDRMELNVPPPREYAPGSGEVISGMEAYEPLVDPLLLLLMGKQGVQSGVSQGRQAFGKSMDYTRQRMPQPPPAGPSPSAQQALAGSEAVIGEMVAGHGGALPLPRPGRLGESQMAAYDAARSAQSPQGRAMHSAFNKTDRSADYSAKEPFAETLRAGMRHRDPWPPSRVTNPATSQATPLTGGLETRGVRREAARRGATESAGGVAPARVPQGGLERGVLRGSRDAMQGMIGRPGGAMARPSLSAIERARSVEGPAGAAMRSSLKQHSPYKTLHTEESLAGALRSGQEAARRGASESAGRVTGSGAEASLSRLTGDQMHRRLSNQEVAEILKSRGINPAEWRGGRGDVGPSPLQMRDWLKQRGQ